MDDSLRVGGREPRTDLPRQVERLFLRETADSMQERGQILAVHVLHRDEGVTLELTHVIDAAHIRVGDLARNADLADESAETVGIAF